MKCSICEYELKRNEDVQKVRGRGAAEDTVRCLDYENCMLRAARNKRKEIGAEEVTHGHR